MYGGRRVWGSLPSRERGLKYTRRNVGQAGTESLPSRERGLKYKILCQLNSKLRVAPLAGAWIEIVNTLCKNILNVVAPLAGAWIEI